MSDGIPNGIFGSLYPSDSGMGSIGTGISAYQPSGGLPTGYNPVGAGGGGIFGSLGSLITPSNIQTGTSILGGLTGLAQLYGMFQNLGMQKKAFKFAREGTKRNFNAQATAYNEAVASKETARRAYASQNNQDYSSMYGYGTGQKVEKWT